MPEPRVSGVLLAPPILADQLTQSGGGADSAHPILSPPQDFFRRTLHVIKRRITDYSCKPPIHFQEKIALVFALSK